MTHIKDNINALVALCHGRAKAAGWWTDLATGEPLQRNIGELLCLVHSEVSEADEGYCGNLHFFLPDDKLPHRSMFEVEIADAQIRIYDLCGGLNVPLGEIVQNLAESKWLEQDDYLEYAPGRLLREVHKHISRAMEGHRKGSFDTFGLELGKASHLLDLIAHANDLDLPGAIAEKLQYNATRQDHTIEARQRAGGKRF